MKTPLLVALLLLPIAGCVGGHATGTEPTETIAAGPAGYDEVTGGVDGLVTDTEIQPVSDAQVGLLEDAAARTVTDASGRFSFSNLAPGTYTLAVTKLGYEPIAKKIEVRVGEATSVNVALSILPVKVPYSELRIHKGEIQNGVGFMESATCSNCGTNQTRTEYNDGFPEDWVGFTIEVTWRTNDFLGIDFLDRGDNSVQYHNVYWRVRQANPVHGYIERCGDYREKYYAGSHVPCSPGEFAMDNKSNKPHKLLVEDWYVGGYQDTTHMLDPACPLYKAGCYGIGVQPSLVFTNYLTLWHMDVPPGVETYSALPDQ